MEQNPNLRRLLDTLVDKIVPQMAPAELLTLSTALAELVAYADQPAATTEAILNRLSRLADVSPTLEREGLRTAVASQLRFAIADREAKEQFRTQETRPRNEIMPTLRKVQAAVQQQLATPSAPGGSQGRPQ